MKAAVFHRPGEKLTIEEVRIDNPGPREVLIRTAAVGLCHSDLHYIDGLYTVNTPAILGHEAAGIVEKVGADVTALRPGDHVITCLSVFVAIATIARPGCPSAAIISMRPGAVRPKNPGSRWAAGRCITSTTSPGLPNRCWCMNMRW